MELWFTFLHARRGIRIEKFVHFAYVENANTRERLRRRGLQHHAERTRKNHSHNRSSPAEDENSHPRQRRRIRVEKLLSG